MSLNLNIVLLAGRLSRDPVLKNVGNDRVVADFGLAVNRRYKGPDGEYKEDVTFVDVEAWARTAELVGQYLAKGSACYLEGRLRLDTWTDKDNVRRNRLKIVADTVQFVGAKKASTPEAVTPVTPPRVGEHSEDYGVVVAGSSFAEQAPF
jgi:single-strand DNA-binding protein